MKRKGNKSNVGNKLSNYSLAYVRTGTRMPKGFKQASQAKVLALRFVRRLLRGLLRFIPLGLLIEATERKVGKPTSRGEQARKEALAYNEGRQDERKVWKEKVSGL